MMAGMRCSGGLAVAVLLETSLSSRLQKDLSLSLSWRTFSKVVAKRFQNLSTSPHPSG